MLQMLDKSSSTIRTSYFSLTFYTIFNTNPSLVYETRVYLIDKARTVEIFNDSVETQLVGLLINDYHSLPCRVPHIGSTPCYKLTVANHKANNKSFII